MGNDTAWIIGCTINITGQLIINLGTNVMKFSHSKNAARPLEAQKATLRQKTWLLGLLVFALGNTLNFVSLSFAPQVLLSALGSVQLISNVFWGWCLLRETITAKLIAATAVMVVGQVVAVAFSTHKTKVYSAEDLQELYLRVPFQAYAAVMLVVVLLLAFSQYMLRPHITGSGGGPQVVQAARPPWVHRYVPLAFALISTIVGSSSVMLAKSSSVLLHESITGTNQFLNVFTYTILMSWIIVTVFWMYRFNAGLQQFDGVYIVPLLQVLWTVFAIISGGIYFREFEDFTSMQALGFGAGVLLIVLGVYLLSQRNDAATMRNAAAMAVKSEHRLSFDSEDGPEEESKGILRFSRSGPKHGADRKRLAAAAYKRSPLAAGYGLVPENDIEMEVFHLDPVHAADHDHDHDESDNVVGLPDPHHPGRDDAAARAAANADGFEMSDNMELGTAASGLASFSSSRGAFPSQTSSNNANATTASGGGQSPTMLPFPPAPTTPALATPGAVADTPVIASEPSPAAAAAAAAGSPSDSASSSSPADHQHHHHLFPQSQAPAPQQQLMYTPGARPQRESRSSLEDAVSLDNILSVSGDDESDNVTNFGSSRSGQQQQSQQSQQQQQQLTPRSATISSPPLQLPVPATSSSRRGIGGQRVTSASSSKSLSPPNNSTAAFHPNNPFGTGTAVVATEEQTASGSFRRILPLITSPQSQNQTEESTEGDDGSLI